MRFLPALPLLFVTAALYAAPEQPAAEKNPQPSKAEIEAAMAEHAAAVLGSVKYKEGTAELPGGMARLELPKGYRYLNGSDARKVVVDLWGNPPDQGSDLLGMVVPAGEDLTKSDSWAIVITFQEDGHVSDKDADEIDYSELLSQLQEASSESNKQRAAQGYETMNLKGWAVTPRYDKEQKVLYWAKQYDVPGSPDGTLNYDVRVLGRRGVLSLNGVAGMSRVKDVEAATPAIVAMARYNDGHRYADFNSATDKKADYSLAGLVLGGAVAAKLAGKVGLLAKLGAFWKVILFGIVAAGAFVKKLFRGKSAA